MISLSLFMIFKLSIKATIVLTTEQKFDWFKRSAINYLEYELIDRAANNGTLDCDNKQSGNKEELSKYIKVELDQYLNEALLLLKVLGIYVFSETKKKTKVHKPSNKRVHKDAGLLSNHKTDKLDADTLLKGGAPSAKYFKSVLLSKGVFPEKGNSTIAKINKDGSGRYWANPPIEYLDTDWVLGLNDNINRKLYVFRIPANSISRDEIKTRTTKTGAVQLDLEIVFKNEKFICVASRIDYTPWYSETWDY